MFHFMLSRDWIDHLTSDRYLTETGFRELYGADCARRRDDPAVGVHGSLVDLVWRGTGFEAESPATTVAGA